MEDLYHLGVKALIQDTHGKVLLLRANAAVLRTNRDGVYWDIPGGRIRRGDTVQQTLAREIAEETGMTGVEVTGQLGMVLSNIRIPLASGGDVGLVLAIFLCRMPARTHIVLSVEHTAFGWYEPSEAAKLLQIKYPPELTERVARLSATSMM